MAGRNAMGGQFDRFGKDDVRDLIARYPLAWLVAADGTASLLPLLGVYADDGRLIELFGHMGRANPLHAMLGDDGRATILFNGPQGYVSPDQAQRRNWGPTWNYAQLSMAVQLRFVPEETAASIEQLTDAMEAGAWTHAELGPRSAGMMAAIVAFRARVTTLTGRFKLGQDESDEVFEAICRNHPDAALVEWMRRFRR